MGEATLNEAESVCDAGRQKASKLRPLAGVAEERFEQR
jgi:hypothetical protein